MQEIERKNGKKLMGERETVNDVRESEYERMERDNRGERMREKIKKKLERELPYAWDRYGSYEYGTSM